MKTNNKKPIKKKLINKKTGEAVFIKKKSNRKFSHNVSRTA